MDEKKLKRLEAKGYKYIVPEEVYRKAIFQLRSGLMEILTPLELYGQKPYCDQALEEIVILAEQFGKRIRGRDVPIAVIRKGGKE